MGKSARVGHGLVFVNDLFCLGNLFYIAWGAKFKFFIQLC